MLLRELLISLPATAASHASPNSFGLSGEVPVWMTRTSSSTIFLFTGPLAWNFGVSRGALFLQGGLFLLPLLLLLRLDFVRLLLQVRHLDRFGGAGFFLEFLCLLQHLLKIRIT